MIPIALFCKKTSVLLMACLAVLLTLALIPAPVNAEEPLPQDLILEVGFDQKLNQQLPPDLSFVDSTGQPVTLGSYFGDRPLVLTLGYYECPMLCSLVRNGMFESLREIELTIGEDYDVLVVSIDPEETPEIAEAKRRASIIEYGRSTSPEGWNFLVGSEENIQQLAEAIGFRYRYDPRLDEYAHPSGILVITPEGRISKYFYGIEFPPRNVRLGLVEAADNKIGSAVDQLLLTCYHYDPVSGEYTLAIMSIIRFIGGGTILIIGTIIFVMLRRDWNRTTSPNPA